MVMLDIPFSPDKTTHWVIRVPNIGLQTFPSRDAALKFAMDFAKRQSALVYISVEGADGRWRLFDADLQTIA
jgi:hypothetical protein